VALSRIYPEICLERMRKTIKVLSQDRRPLFPKDPFSVPSTLWSPSGLSSSGFPTNILYIVFSSLIHYFPHIEEGYNTCAVGLRVVQGDGKGSQCLGIYYYYYYYLWGGTESLGIRSSP
jgi:hypothetical protein